MWATLALTAALSLAPHQAGQLKLTNARTCYGFLGPTRPKDQFLPGDVYFVTFDIENLDVREDGKVLYSMGMQLLNDKGKSEFTKDPQNLESTNSLGGTSMPGYASTVVGYDTAPGKYTLKLTVTDRRSKQTQTLERTFEVLPPQFGLVRLSLFYYMPTPNPAPYVAVCGQSLLVNAEVVGFTRDKTTEQPNIGITVRVLDEQGNETLKKPLSDQVGKEVQKEVKSVPLALPLQLNRPGKFTVVLEATDRITKKDTKLSFPLHVVELKSKE